MLWIQQKPLIHQRVVLLFQICANIFRCVNSPLKTRENNQNTGKAAFYDDLRVQQTWSQQTIITWSYAPALDTACNGSLLCSPFAKRDVQKSLWFSDDSAKRAPNLIIVIRHCVMFVTCRWESGGKINIYECTHAMWIWIFASSWFVQRLFIHEMMFGFRLTFSSVCWLPSLMNFNGASSVHITAGNCSLAISHNIPGFLASLRLRLNFSFTTNWKARKVIVTQFFTLSRFSITKRNYDAIIILQFLTKCFSRSMTASSKANVNKLGWWFIKT